MSKSISDTETATVIDFTENTPHVTVMTHDDDAHVLAVSSIRNIINGKYPPANLGDDVLRRIIQEWLQNLENKS